LGKSGDGEQICAVHVVWKTPVIIKMSSRSVLMQHFHGLNTWSRGMRLTWIYFTLL